MEARKLAERALDLAVRHGERGNQGWALRLQAELVAQQASPDVEGAEALYRQALALAEELEMRPLQAHCHLGLGELYGGGGAALSVIVSSRGQSATANCISRAFWTTLEA